MMSTRTCSGLVLVALLALSACGGGTKKVDPAADLAAAKGALLTSADLPGYSSTPHQKSDDIPAAEKKKFADCMKVSTTIFDDIPGAQKADSPDFAKDPATSISNSVEIDPKKSDVDTVWDQISKAGIEPCLQQLFEAAVKQGGSGVTVGSSSVTRFDVGIGTRSTGFAVKIAAGQGADKAVFYADLIFVQRDRAGLQFTYFNVAAPLDRKFETSLAQKSYDRIGNKAK